MADQEADRKYVVVTSTWWESAAHIVYADSPQEAVARVREKLSVKDLFDIVSVRVGLATNLPTYDVAKFKDILSRAADA